MEIASCSREQYIQVEKEKRVDGMRAVIEMPQRFNLGFKNNVWPLLSRRCQDFLTVQVASDFLTNHENAENFNFPGILLTLSIGCLPGLCVCGGRGKPLSSSDRPDYHALSCRTTSYD
jgi:hypothetical protein